MISAWDKKRQIASIPRVERLYAHPLDEINMCLAAGLDPDFEGGMRLLLPVGVERIDGVVL
jgi:hypothetical protein